MYPSISPSWPEQGARLYFNHYISDTDVDIYEATWMASLQAGDADQDFDFDQLDLVRVLQAGKYLTGEPATWGEGDWDGAPGGSVEDEIPPPGNGQFDQLDIIAALNSGKYLTGPYAALAGGEGEVLLNKKLTKGNNYVFTRRQ